MLRLRLRFGLSRHSNGCSSRRGILLLPSGPAGSGGYLRLVLLDKVVWEYARTLHSCGIGVLALIPVGINLLGD
jgi:hypothetical protein